MVRRVMKRLMVILLAVSVVGGVGFGLDTQTAHAAGKTVKAKSVTLNHKVYTVKKGGKIKLKAKVTPKKATQKKIVWTSSNKKIATVKNGKVKGLKKGKVTITAKVKGTKKKAKATIYVGTPVKKAVFKIKELTLTKGQTQTVKATLSPKKPTVKSIKYTSSNKSVATVTSGGKITAVGTGKAVITATPKDEAGKKATLTVTVTESEDESGGKTDPVKPDKPAATEAEASDEAGISKALADSNIKKITVRTDDSVNINIPETEGTEDKTLVIDAPNGHIENHAKFNDVQIKSISSSSYVEYAVGNTITYSATSGRVQIEQNASATILLGNGAENINLVNNGTISQLVISTKTGVDISGTSNNPVPVEVKSDAKNSVLTTDQELNINTETKIILKILEGGELTEVNIVNTSNVEAALPEVSGVGVITITNEEVHYKNVVAENDGSAVSTVTLEGAVSGEDADGVSISLIPYKGELTDAQVKAAAGSAVYTTKSASNGSYKLENIALGNYYLLAQKEGCRDEVLKLNVDSRNSGIPSISMTKTADSEKTGTISGKIKDAETGGNLEDGEGITLLLRAGANNISGEILDTTETSGDGVYAFTKPQKFGQYTIELVDKRTGIDSKYITTSFAAVISAEGVNTANSSASRVIKSEQVRFKLWWGNKASGASSDLDSHLIGPTADGSRKFHTWYSDMSYSEDDDNGVHIKYADLDVDDTTWEGPETTTIYKKTNGVYSFYVHDYTNSNNNKSSQMSRSSALVEVYMGDRKVNTFNVPNKSGILWHVCDYDSYRNKVTSVNEVLSDWAGQPSDVGLSAEDILNNARADLSDSIEEAKSIADSLTAGDAKTEGEKLIQDAEAAKNGTDVQAMREARDNLNNWTYNVKHPFKVSGVHAYTDPDEEDDLVTDWWSDYDGSEDEEYKVIVIEGRTAEIPDNLEITFTNSDVSASRSASDKDGYDFKLTTSLDGQSDTFYVRYSQDEYYVLGINRVNAIETITDEDGNTEEEDLIEDWYTENVWDDEDENILFRELIITGRTTTLPENLEVITRDSNATATVGNSDKDGYEKMVTIKNGDLSRVYYIRYSQDEYYALGINRVNAIETVTDEGGDTYEENLIENWDTGNVWDDEGENILFRELIIKGRTTTLPENLEVITRDSNATATVGNSDKDGYEKMVTVKNGDLSRVYYIRYSVDESYAVGIDGVKAVETISDENGYTYEENLIENWDTGNVWDDEGENILFRELIITGRTTTLPENLEVITRNSNATATVGNSDKDGYEKMVTVKNGDLSAAYYIRYSQSYAYRSKDELFENAEDLGTVETADVENVDVPAGGVMFKFTPAADGTYDIWSSNDADTSPDTYGELYDSGRNQIASNDDDGDGNNFKINNELTAGETYYILLRGYRADNSFTASLHIAPYSGSVENQEPEL